MPTINDLRQQAATIKNATQVGENTATRVGTTFETIADLLEGMGGVTNLSTIDIGSIDTLNTTGDMLVGTPNIYTLTKTIGANTFKVGTLFQFANNGRYDVAQVIVSQFIVDADGRIDTTSADQEVHIFYRLCKTMNGGTLPTPIGTWTTWTELGGSGGSGVTIDPYPTQNSGNAVSSGGVFERLQDIAPKVDISAIDDIDEYTDMLATKSPFYVVTKTLSGNVFRIGTLMEFANQGRYILYQILATDYVLSDDGTLDTTTSENGGLKLIWRMKQFSGNPPAGVTIGVWSAWSYLSGGGGGYQPDNEDIDLNANDQLQFANKLYDASAFSGLGRVYLRKNIVTSGGVDKNVLTAAMISEANTIYRIQYDYDINGQTITLPAGCVLEFDGGSVKNGTIKIDKDNCALIGNGETLNVSVEVGVWATGCKNLLIKGLNFDGDRTLQDGIYCPTSSPCHQTIIADCTIHGYTRNGINVSGRNLLIKDNLLFNNGTGTITENARSGSGVDIVAGSLTGASENFSNIPNIIVKGNKCLSSEVDRHIDSGELYAETNILIEGNICVSMDATAENEVSDTFARHGIMVGYNGTSNLDKYANISNNVVKYGRWSGIYIRANNSSPETKGTTKYVVTCTGNYIYGISLHDDSGNMGGIACELRDGSIVANNTIKNCVGLGINLGFVFTDGETKVSDNYIEATDRGIYVDTYSQKYDIFHNTIIAGLCISVSTASATAQPITYNNYGSICNNILYPKLHGISVDQALADTVTISGNIIKYDTTTRDSNGIGIRIRQYNVNELKIESNTITDAIKGISIYRITGAYRDDIAFINANVIARATTGVECVNGNSSYILPIFNTQFIGCTTNFPPSSGIIPALSKDGEKCVFYTQQAIIESAKEWRVGDVIIANNGLVYSIAVCQVAATKTNGVPTAFTSKWSVFGGQGTNEEGNIKRYAYRGSIFYNTSKNLPAYFSGASWYGFNNYTLNKTFGTTADRPTFAANTNKGFLYFNITTIRFEWWDGAKWTNINDFILSLHQGTTANRPNFQPSEGDIGYPYYDTTLMRQLFMSSGLEQELQITASARVDSSTPSRESNSNTLQSNKKYWVGYSNKQSWGGKMAFRKTASVEATDADEIIILPNFNEVAQGRWFTSPDPTEYPYIYTENSFSLAEVLTFEIVVPYWIEQDGAKAGVLRHGVTADRPASTDIYVGFEYFDETLGKPIYWNGTAYVDATGTAV